MKRGHDKQSNEQDVQTKASLNNKLIYNDYVMT